MVLTLLPLCRTVLVVESQKDVNYTVFIPAFEALSRSNSLGLERIPLGDTMSPLRLKIRSGSDDIARILKMSRAIRTSQSHCRICSIQYEIGFEIGSRGSRALDLARLGIVSGL